MFRSYLKVNDACPHCGEELFHQRSDDAPPYMTIFVVGHIIGTFMILVEEFWPDAPIWLHAMVWPTITLILSLWLLPIIKRSHRPSMGLADARFRNSRPRRNRSKPGRYSVVTALGNRRAGPVKDADEKIRAGSAELYSQL